MLGIHCSTECTLPQPFPSFLLLKTCISNVLYASLVLRYALLLSARRMYLWVRFKRMNKESTHWYGLQGLLRRTLRQTEAGRQVCCSYMICLPVSLVLFRSSDYGVETFSTNVLPFCLRTLSGALSLGLGDVLGDFQISLTLS